MLKTIKIVAISYVGWTAVRALVSQPHDATLSVGALWSNFRYYFGQPTALPPTFKAIGA